MLTVAEVALAPIASAAFLRVERLLVMDTEFFGDGRRLIHHFGYSLLLQSWPAQLTAWTLLGKSALGSIRLGAALHHESCS